MERPTDLSGVVDVDDAHEGAERHSRHSVHRLGTSSAGTIFAFHQHPGCFLIRGAIHPGQQRELVSASLTDYLQSPVSTNLGNVGDRMLVQGVPLYEKDPSNDILRRLRWASLGPRFDWTRRVYVRDEEEYIPLPQVLKELAIKLMVSVNEVLQNDPISKNSEEFENIAKEMSKLCSTAGCPSYNPEAALINFYHEGDTLGGHIDDAEPNCALPLVSLSLGCSAIFLIGGLTRSVTPTPVLLRSGDAVVLAGPARRSFHGVPRILKANDAKAVDTTSDGNVENYMQKCRINISIRALGTSSGPLGLQQP